MSILAWLLLACTPDPGLDSRPGDSGPPQPFAAGLEARLDDHIGSLVWLSWDQLGPGTPQVEWLDGETWIAGPAIEGGAGPKEQLVLGVPFGAEVALRVVTTTDGGRWTSDEVAICTAALPEGLSHAAVLIQDEGGGDPDLGWIFTSSVGMSQGESWSLILDRAGRVVWALASPQGRLTLQPQIAADGRSLLVDHNSFYGSLDGGAASQVQRLSIDGAVLATYATPGLHHGFTATGDGSIAWGATHDTGYDSLEVLDPSGVQRTLWDCADLHAALGTDQACQNNGVAWNPASERFLLSFFTTESLVELGPDGEPQRWFGQLPGAWGFTSTGTVFRWQHGAHITADDTLLLSSHSSAIGDEVMVREYALDQGSQLLEQVWSHGQGQGLDAPMGGDVHRLASDNTLHSTGSGGRIREITPAGEVVWDLSFPATYLGRTTPVEDLYALLP